MDLPSPFSIEYNTIHPIPRDKRHGTWSYLFTIWFGCNMNILTVTTGALATTEFGLTFTAALMAIVLGVMVGNVFMALHAAQGPRLGVPQMIQTRGQFGSMGSLLVVAAVVLMYIGFVASNLVVGGESVHLVMPRVSISTGVAVLGGMSLIATIYGYDLIHEFSKYVSIIAALALAAVFVSLVYFVGLPRDFTTTGVFTWPQFTREFSVAALWALTFAPCVSDYTRYMPWETGVSPAFWATYWGNSLGSMLPMILGAMLGIVVGNGNIVEGVIHGSGILALPVIVVLSVGLVCGTAINAYCGVLATLTFVQVFVEGWLPGRNARVMVSVLLFAACVSIGIIGQVNFLKNYMNFLYLLLYVLVPWTAINLIDYYLIRRGSYDAASFVRSDGGIYGRVQWPAVASYVFGFLIEIPFMAQSAYTGPVAKMLGGADVSWIVSLVVISPVYYLLSKIGSKAPISAVAVAP